MPALNPGAVSVYTKHVVNECVADGNSELVLVAHVTT